MTRWNQACVRFFIGRSVARPRSNEPPVLPVEERCGAFESKVADRRRVEGHRRSNWRSLTSDSVLDASVWVVTRRQHVNAHRRRNIRRLRTPVRRIQRHPRYAVPSAREPHEKALATETRRLEEKGFIWSAVTIEVRDNPRVARRRVSPLWLSGQLIVGWKAPFRRKRRIRTATGSEDQHAQS